MALNIIMLGPPGAGKGTQTARVAATYGVPTFSTGDVLREAVRTGSELGRAAKAIMEAGQLVNDETMVGIVRERLERSEVAKGFVLDGFPRTVKQSVALDSLMADKDPLVVLEIAVEEDELLERLLARRVCEACGATPEQASEEACARCGGRLVQRSDDEESVIRERFAVYQRDTRPLVDYYRARPTFHSVDGAQSVAEVTAALDAVIAPMVGGGAPAVRAVHRP